MDINKVIAIIREGSSIIQGRSSKKKVSYKGPTGDHKRDKDGTISASHYEKRPGDTKRKDALRKYNNYLELKKKIHAKDDARKKKAQEHSKKTNPNYGKSHGGRKYEYTNVKEDAPTMSMGGGGIAGSVEAGDDPPVGKKKKNIYMGLHSRKRWLDYINGKGSGKS